ncbi:MAG: T9SS type A sorting domain-containing protein, partial [Bacteroidota bacterium]|nr:T9SS type A sorting domain-containing protein [Bacteroidota bacterium]
PASSSDLYRCFVLDIENPVDRFITGMEVIPGNTSMVHHVLVFQDTTGEARILDEQDIIPGYTSFGGIGVGDAKLIGAWVPGEQAFFTPEGMGIKLFANADIVIQVHYPATSLSEVDSTRINLQMSNAGFLRPLAIDAVLEHTWSLTNGPLVIPPNEVKSFHSEFQVPFPSTIVSIAPHAHLVCTSMKSYAVLPSGDTIPLIDIPQWDFRWQGHYSFRSPIYLPTGTMLHGEATYDNTTNNPFNPNTPPQWVFLGEATTNEMMLFYFAWTPGIPSDEDMVIDDQMHMDHHMDCIPSLVGINDGPEMPQFQVWPSPAQDQIWIGGDRIRGDATIYDGVGRQVKRIRIDQDVQQIAVGDLARGHYVIELKDISGGVARRSIVLE